MMCQKIKIHIRMVVKNISNTSMPQVNMGLIVENNGVFTHQNIYTQAHCTPTTWCWTLLGRSFIDVIGNHWVISSKFLYTIYNTLMLCHLGCSSPQPLHQCINNPLVTSVQHLCQYSILLFMVQPKNIYLPISYFISSKFIKKIK